MSPSLLESTAPLLRLFAGIGVALAASGCGEVWNDPYPGADGVGATLYTSFSERPKHLDPARSYTADEAEFTANIYEPPFQYHYLKRPYELIPAAAQAVPKPRYLDSGGRELPDDAPIATIAQSVYEIRIRPGIRYAPHPAFVAANRAMPRAAIVAKTTLAEFGAGGTRELTAADYVYEIKRLASPRVNSPIYGHLTDYIVGLKEYGEALKGDLKRLETERGKGAWLDLRSREIAGVKVLDTHAYAITVKGKYPQFPYWLAMPFFAPIPWEADAFYAQDGMAERNFSLNWYPVGTGPYMLTENNPNARMVLAKNPHFRGEPYPAEGEPGDRAAGLLADAGKTMPFIERVVFTREREQIPYWNKFLQGYYDRSGIDSDNFDQVVRAGSDGEAGLTPEMEVRGIRLRTSTATTSFYLAFNWRDPVVGGADAKSAARAKKLRQAISIALDFEEFISIFRNGRGIAGQGPIPPGIFGFRDGTVNPVVYAMDGAKPKRRAVEEARKLMTEAGYPGGRDAASGAPLVLYLDTRDGGPGDKARIDWYRKQFAKIDIQLEIRGTDWNRFQEKIRRGNTQMFFLGWNADYPDPENFLFLLYGPNGAVAHDGENKANYLNPEFDRLFEQMKNMDNGPERQAVIDAALKLLQDDAPWVWGFHPKSYSLAHAWMKNGKPNQMANNGLKYQRLDADLRAARRAEWNRPVVWPFGLLVAALALLAWLGRRAWARFEAATALGDSAPPATGSA
jgi:ABC-type transport system substrate-binding protein